MPVSYGEEQGSPTEQHTPNGLEVTRRLRCAWVDRATLADELLGTAYSRGGITPTLAICRRVSTNPFDAENVGAGSYAAYADAIVEASYTERDPVSGTLPEVVDEELVSERFEGTAEFLTRPYDRPATDAELAATPAKKRYALYFWDAGKTIPITEKAAPGLLLTGFDYILTKHQVDDVPDDILSLQGHCNVDAVTCRTEGLTGLTFAAQTLLFQPPTISRVITTAGAKTWTQDLRFKFKPQGWNVFFRDATQAWATMYDADGDAVLIYPTGDFSVF